MRRILIYFFTVLLAGCIRPFDMDTTEAEKMLVVNGLITDAEGPYTVKLNKSAAAASYFGSVDPSVNKATVIISDETGLSETLTQTKEGEYQTKAKGIRGRVGGTYTLYIRLQNGEEFVSEPETLKAVAEVDRFYYDVKESLSLTADGFEVKKYDLEVKVDFKDPAAERNYYRWTSIGTYEVETQPEEYFIIDDYGNVINLPKPCCRQCWVTREDNAVYALSDQQFNGNNKISHVVGTIPVSPRFIGKKYHVALKQYSISEKAYTFWHMLHTQASGTGSVQDPAPANVKGNLVSKNNPEKPVLGYFGASGVKEVKMFIDGQDLPFNILRFDFPDDCRVIPRSTTVKPSFWK